MKPSGFEQHPEDLWSSLNMRPRRSITVRHFVIAVAVTGTAYLVRQRTGDEILTLLSMPMAQGFFSYWITD
ncbi:hypothetical protein GA0070621_1092 [Micromonospora narathiwatensis]|uniref:Uncharacterized protein n=1 Tax=Micromonospora narathiwatensis TaxID=299146 RepID=A0A1A8ZAU9_9ACTN|nr:hypothetical protein GA0070621_1092 [Micromonospora narathiwatensis]